MTTHLILGGARSGKSSRAELLAKHYESESMEVVYIATAPLMQYDHEWQHRIRQHQQTRPPHWQTIEESLELCAVLGALKSNQCAVVDCLTLWLFSIINEKRDIEREVEALCACLHELDQTVILVSNELGMGLVPEHQLGRQFRDAQGRLNQAVAKLAGSVEFVIAGLPILMKGDAVCV